MLKRNVILITIDSLRADHLSCFGYSRRTSPNLDALAKRGVLFSQCVSNGPATLASFSSMLTSTYPLTQGGYRYLSEKRPIIAKIMRENGYNTAAFNSSPFLLTNRNFDEGFNTFVDFVGETSSISLRKKKIGFFLKNYPFLYKLFSKLHTYISLQKEAWGYRKAEVLTQRAMSWLRSSSDNFFLWVHFMDVHYPYNPPQDYLKEFCSEEISARERTRMLSKMLGNPESISQDELENLISLYDGEIRYLDHFIGSFINEISELDFFPDTFIIITSDHGEEFKEHGSLLHPDKLYDELLRVPLIIVGPLDDFGIDKEIIVEEQISLLDLTPTIVDLLNIPKIKGFQGRSLLPVIKGEEKGRDAISETETKVAYRTGDWKYILHLRENREELYDLRSDVKETINLHKQSVRKTREFKSKILDHLALVKKENFVSPRVEVEEEIVERLRKLGYM